ncbi:PREDICTED: uncharacterized protein CYSTATIN-B isoform X2 [Myotis davidii]|uniref:uncharacterized protein CYSTATIN-B isoform X2 n=1 Tax=Myotis davidii TaxID=225400 RepID=UPI00076788F1|nr:PREDICTED: uncharacterized protein CYSTATIN-B isoform X2 [Myotis davidii]
MRWLVGSPKPGPPRPKSRPSPTRAPCASKTKTDTRLGCRGRAWFRPWAALDFCTSVSSSVKPRGRPFLPRLPCAFVCVTHPHRLAHLLQGQIPADQTCHLARQVKPQLEEKESKNYPIFKATKYRSQVVAGINYFIKVQVADDDYVHLRVFQGLPPESQIILSKYLTHKTKEDPIVYF